MTAGQAAKALGVNRATLRQWIEWGVAAPPKRQPVRGGHVPRLKWTDADIERVRLARRAWPEHRGQRRKRVDRDRVASLRADGKSWDKIGAELGLAYRTVRRAGAPVQSGGRYGRPRKTVDVAKRALT